MKKTNFQTYSLSNQVRAGFSCLTTSCLLHSTCMPRMYLCRSCAYFEANLSSFIKTLLLGELYVIILPPPLPHKISATASRHVKTYGKNTQVFTGLQTSCYKSVHNSSCSCCDKFRTICYIVTVSDFVGATLQQVWYNAIKLVTNC
jgi:hypothetical protein